MIITQSILVDRLARIREQDKSQKIVFTNGCFDLLHPGHIALLETCKMFGILVVGVNSDESVRRLKGPSRPINDLNFRLNMLTAIEHVDFVVSFEEDTPVELIKKIRPDLLVKGGDYSPDQIAGSEEVKRWGGEVALVPYMKGYSTTDLINRIYWSVKSYESDSE